MKRSKEDIIYSFPSLKRHQVKTAHLNITFYCIHLIEIPTLKIQ